MSSRSASIGTREWPLPTLPLLHPRHLPTLLPHPPHLASHLFSSSHLLSSATSASGIFERTYELWALFFYVPSIFVLVKDLLGEIPIRFSLSHCIFLVAVLYKLGFNAASIDSQLLINIEDGLEYYEMEGFAFDAITICMICHFIIFITVTSLGKISLRLISTNNACAHLLFPFQAR